jgi:hypothetical protein
MGFDIDKHIAWVEHLYDEQQTVEDLKQIYSLDVHYRDPFQEVIGVDRRVHAICEKVFDQMDQISIQVTGHAVNGNVAFISWKMNVTYEKKLETIEGTTRLVFDEKGLVKDTVDYYDASIVFETVSVLGSSLKWLRKRLA